MHIIGLSSQGGQVSRNLPYPSWQYSKRQTRGEEIEKCLEGGLEPTYYYSIFRKTHMKTHMYNSLISTSTYAFLQVAVKVTRCLGMIS